MPYSKLLVHLVWSTKNRDKLISLELKQLLLNHILGNAKRKEIVIISLNCTSDHIHLLVSLKPDQSVSNIVRLIKGESSFWINKQNILKRKFEWQEEYFAVSVSESIREKVVAYIENQEEHHKTNSFMDEYNTFIKKYNFNK